VKQYGLSSSMHQLFLKRSYRTVAPRITMLVTACNYVFDVRSNITANVNINIFTVSMNFCIL